MDQSDRCLPVFWTSFNAWVAPQWKDNSPVGREWIMRRFMIWKQFAWPSIKRQDVQDFVYVVSCNANSRDIVQPLFNSVDDKRLMVSYTGTKQERQVIAKISKMSPKIAYARLDSDDMYHPKVSRLITIQRDSVEWFCFREGYGYDWKNSKMYTYRCGKHGGPFFGKIYRNNFHLKKAMRTVNHEVVGEMCPRILSNGMFIVGVTGHNTTTVVRSKFFKRKLSQRCADKVKEEFRFHVV